MRLQRVIHVARIAAATLGALIVVTASAAQAGPPRVDTSRLPENLPNLVPLKPFDIHVTTAESGKGKSIRFGISTANRGEYAFELAGVPDPADAPDSQALQCILWAGPRACAQRTPVGTFRYHEAHQHYHFEDYALFELRRLKDGQPVMSRRGLVAPSKKASFCIIDSEPDDYAQENPVYQQPWPLYFSCIAGVPGVGFTGIQGISPGWRDTYTSGLPGQEIPIEGVPDGTYALVVTVDPMNRIFETSDEDNMAFVMVRLAAQTVVMIRG
jgi:hypothetical protein